MTATRAEYGLLYWLLRELQARPGVDLQLLVTGSHLDPRFGHTISVIHDDRFSVAAQVHMLLASDEPVAVAKSMSLALAGAAEAFARLGPDIVVLLGDRYETLAAASAATVLRVPIAHIHGGEITEGAMDDALRHATTTLAALHFVAAEPFRQRVLQLGAHPDLVHTVGAPGLDHLDRESLLDGRDLDEALGVQLRSPVFVVTYHPPTRGRVTPRDGASALFAALDNFPDATVLITGVNADSGRQSVLDAAAAWLDRQVSDRVRVYASLGSRRYLSALARADVVIGNSSSGIIEAPAVGVSTVNIGARQRGRPRASSVIDCDERRDGITAAIRRALSDDFRRHLPDPCPPYGRGGASRRMADVLVSVDLRSLDSVTFRDLPVTSNVPHCTSPMTS